MYIHVVVNAEPYVVCFTVTVRKVHTQLLQVLVEYIDYGNEEVTDRMKLRIALDTELFSLPPQVLIECTECTIY